jgi:hypothetical protein
MKINLVGLSWHEFQNEEINTTKFENCISWSQNNVIAMSTIKSFFIKEKRFVLFLQSGFQPIFLLIPNDYKNNTMIITEHTSIIKGLEWSDVFSSHLLMSYDEENLLCIWKNKVYYFFNRRTVV